MFVCVYLHVVTIIHALYSNNQLELNIVNPIKKQLEEENRRNNDDKYLTVEAENNNEPNQQGSPPSTPPEVGGQTTDAEVHQEEDDTLTEDDDNFPVTTTAVLQHTSPTPYPTNDTMLVASTAIELPHISSRNVHPLHDTSPNVNTIAEEVTEIGPNTADVVSHTVTSAVRPHPDRVDEQKKEMEKRHDERYGNGVPSNERR